MIHKALKLLVVSASVAVGLLLTACFECAEILESPPGGPPEDAEIEVEVRDDLASAKAALDLGNEVGALPPTPNPNARTVHRWRWEVPATTEPWAIGTTVAEIKGRTARDLLRVCATEAGFASLNDCTGIWEVAKNIRSRGCRRDLFTRITECDAEGETMRSALRRLQRVVLGDGRPSGRRTRYMIGLDLNCKMPNGFPNATRWAVVEGPRCKRLAAHVDKLVEGRWVPRVTRPARALAWGGRCEVKAGACDDPIACRRGLARIPTDTKNAFWCRPRVDPHCAADLDPICYRMGIVPARFKKTSGSGGNIVGGTISDPAPRRTVGT